MYGEHVENTEFLIVKIIHVTKYPDQKREMTIGIGIK